MNLLSGHRVLKARSYGSGLKVCCVEYFTGAQTEAHSHFNARFVFVLQGLFQETIANRTIDCSRYSVIYRPPGENHSENFRHGKVVCLSVDIGVGEIRQYHQLFPALKSAFQIQNPGALSISARLRQELDFEDEFSRSSVEGLLMELLSETESKRLPVDKAPPFWLQRVIDLLHSEEPRRENLAKIAAEAGIHPVHLSRVFRKIHGCSIADFVRKSRIRQAQQQIVRSTKSLSEIAQQYGFADQSHFTRLFKRFTGITPARFRATFSSVTDKLR